MGINPYTLSKGSVVPSLETISFDTKWKQIIKRKKNRLNISLQIELVTTQEVSVFEKTYKALEFIASTNVSTTIASQDNIQKFLQDIERGKQKIGTLEDLLL